MCARPPRRTTAASAAATAAGAYFKSCPRRTATRTSRRWIAAWRASRTCMRPTTGRTRRAAGRSWTRTRRASEARDARRPTWCPTVSDAGEDDEHPALQGHHSHAHGRLSVGVAVRGAGDVIYLGTGAGEVGRFDAATGALQCAWALGANSKAAPSTSPSASSSWRPRPACFFGSALRS